MLDKMDKVDDTTTENDSVLIFKTSNLKETTIDKNENKTQENTDPRCQTKKQKEVSKSRARKGVLDMNYKSLKRPRDQVDTELDPEQDMISVASWALGTIPKHNYHEIWSHRRPGPD